MTSTAGGDIIFIRTEKNTFKVELTEEQFNSIDRSIKRHYQQLDSKTLYEDKKCNGVRKHYSGCRLPRWKFIVQDNKLILPSAHEKLLKVEEFKILRLEQANKEIKDYSDKIFDKKN